MRLYSVGYLTYLNGSIENAELLGFSEHLLLL